VLHFAPIYDLKFALCQEHVFKLIKSMGAKRACV